MRNRIFTILVFWILFGMFIGNILENFQYILFFLIIISLLCMGWYFIVKKYHFFVLTLWIWILFWGIYSGIFQYFIAENEQFLQPFYGQKIEVIAEVEQLYKKWENQNSYIADIYRMGIVQTPKLRGLVYLPPNFVLSRWDRISFESKISPIENFSPWFAYDKFLLTKGIYFQSFLQTVQKIGKKDLPEWKKWILTLRQLILDTVYNMYPHDEAVFLAGILIGAREDMGKELSNNFNRSWLTHLVAVSGFNITIIIIFLWFLFQFLPLYLRGVLILFCITFFVLLVGDNIPVIRAWIMGWIGYLILMVWRKADHLSILLATALVLVLFSPLSLNYDTSFHLSFLAVVGLLYFQDFWKKVFLFLPKKFAIQESFVLTMSAMTTTLPIMMFGFWQVSIVSPITNMLVGWVIPFAMLFWFLSFLGNILFPIVWYGIGFIEYFLLKYVILVVNFFWWHDIALLKIDFWSFGIYIEILYFMFLCFIIFSKKSPPVESETSEW